MNTPRFSTTALLALALLAGACSQDETEDVKPAPLPPLPEHITLGNLSGAVTDVSQPTNYLLLKSQYALSYHRDRGIPNWVSWHLSPEWLGTADRQDDFRADMTLPAGWYQVSTGSYTGSGFDRGHNCPSADRTSTAADNSATFLMTNILPQAPRNNQQTWANLEAYCRTLVDQGNELYILMGNYGKGGTGSINYKETLDNGRVTVPQRIWKVIVVLPVGNDDAGRVNSTTRVIAVDTPNDNALSTSWGSYRTSVDAIETATGYDILSRVATATQATLEAQIDKGPTQ